MRIASCRWVEPPKESTTMPEISFNAYRFLPVGGTQIMHISRKWLRFNAYRFLSVGGTSLFLCYG